MSFEALLSRTATIVHRAQTGAVDRYNTPTWQETSTSDVACYLEQHARSEDTADREQQVGTHLLVLGPTNTLDGSDRVTIEGTTYEVIGPPWFVDRPGHGIHHIEASLREVA